MRMFMKLSVANILLCLLTIVTMAGCASSEHSAQSKAAKSLDETFRQRQLLSFESQREFDKVYQESVCQRLKGNEDAAVELLTYALKINPNAAEALFDLGMLQTKHKASLLQTKENSDSIISAQGLAMLKKSVELEPSNPYYRKALASYFIENGNYAEAVPLYAKMAEDKPTEENLIILSRLYQMDHKPDEALNTLKHLEQHLGYTEDIAFEMYTIYTEQKHDDEAAEKCVIRLIEENPKETKFQVILGNIYMAEGRVNEGLEIYKKVLDVDPDNTMVKTSMLQYTLQEGDSVQFHKDFSAIMLDPKVDNAQKKSILVKYATETLHNTKGLSNETMYEHFSEALSLPQDDTSIAELCASFCEIAGFPTSYSLKVYEAILRDNPENRDVRLLMIQPLLEESEMEKLADVCHEGTKYHASELLFYYYEGMALYQLGRKAESIVAYEKATTTIDDDTDSDLASDTYATLGDICHDCGLTDKAYAAYEQSIKYNGNNAGSLNNYAYFLSLEGKQLDKALEMSKKAIEIEPNNATYLDTYAWTLYVKRQYTQARIYIDQTIKNLSEEETKSPSSANVYEHAGDIYFRCGEKAQALEFWKHAREITNDKNLKTKLNKKINSKKL